MADIPVSPLAPEAFPVVNNIPGVEFGAMATGMRYKGRLDLLLVRLCQGTQVAGVFTQNSMPAAPVEWCRQALKNSGGTGRGLVVNAGNANAFTGKAGVAAVQSTANAAAEVLGCSPDEILLASTGVIGVPLDVTPIKKALPKIVDGLSASLVRDAAEAIRTTDTYAKAASTLCEIDGKAITITGVAKGSGMIEPNMATMLGFVFTNANISSACLQAILAETNAASFNSITVDSDTSTNDTVLAFATGEAANENCITDPADPRLQGFKAKFAAVMEDLAKQIVCDGEGATKLISVTVKGAESTESARIIAKSIANSPLVKTAIAGEDPNWGRLVMAVGKSGEKANQSALSIWFGDILVATDGQVSSKYQEEDGAAYMKRSHIDLILNVGVGDACSTVWTCDLTHQYISINADYRS
ncbi:arginine biosynthesis bifunctional protein ArgJ [Kordiimonas sediminis]|uniref:Arginine biosynthesis bifunctional protein ArgJ n=1 Tax=Kordiimonas sediminis TaxID=1735581 RepID=A0A919E3W5_9PROT|nr:bifunctional glutamate N-acetyltransferase/amino-acid acetyltransferase ArgJ [Kordiimonas sediminis]GHF10573.1 arginine biosynthesis bifunctional protein ArgJ [Kordiimonas sediminis]